LLSIHAGRLARNVFGINLLGIDLEAMLVRQAL
jgi:hypothetical protein